MRRNLFAGLSILIPIGVTIWVFALILRKLTNPFIGYVKTLLFQFHLIQMSAWDENSAFLHLLAQILIVLILIGLTIVFGIFAKSWLVRVFIQRFDQLLAYLPFLKSIYPPIKKALKLLFDPKIKLLKRVNLIPFPGEMSESLALEIGLESLKPVEKALQFKVDTFLLPTAPNPLMGFLFFIKKDTSKKSLMSVEQTIKYMISLGLLQPENL